MIPTDLVINTLNFIDIVLVGILCILSYKVIHSFDKCGGLKPWWFAILPYVFVYSFISRIGIFLAQADIIPLQYLNVIIASYTIFYLGMIAFLYGLFKICSRVDKHIEE